MSEPSQEKRCYTLGLYVTNKFLAAPQIHGKTTDKNVHPTESQCTAGLTPHRSPSMLAVNVSRQC